MKTILKSDIPASRKEAKLVEKKNLARNRKEIIAKVSLVIFFTFPSLLHYFFLLQFFINNSVRNVETIVLYYASYPYSSENI